ncbi:MAG TPA: chemotaxis protein CheW [Symbiobacteriaceae bacterium]|nr:chemotaxis protein CheW [Symbiobacteriaceae bacterium]
MGTDSDHRTFDWPAIHARLEQVVRRIELDVEDSPDKTRQILRERARELARPLGGETESPRIEVLVVTIGAQRIGIATEQVVTALPGGELTRVPCTPEFIAGVMSHRGRILTVLDLRSLLGMEGPGTEAACQVVAVTGAGMTFGILVGGVEGISQIGLDTLALLQSDRLPCLRGMTAEQVALLDLDAMASDQRVIVNDEVV